MLILKPVNFRHCSFLLMALLFLTSCHAENVSYVVPAPLSNANNKTEVPPTTSDTSDSGVAGTADYDTYLPVVSKPAYYVATDGSDTSGSGSSANPWATISHALDNVPDGVTIFVRPGTYYGQVDLRGTFANGVVVQSTEPYQARLRYDDTVVTCFYGKGITLEGFDISHDGPGAERYVIQIQDLRGSVPGGVDAVSRITLRNNVIHDSYNDDLIKVNNGAREITIVGNIFYNQQGRDSHIDVNSVTDIFIEDNIFFNDFAGSGRSNDNDTGSFIVIKDSNGSDDANLGSDNIIVRRNVFLNWEGDAGNTFIVVGEDTVSYYQAQNVLIENNLMLGNTANVMHSAFHVRGSRDITFRNNTVVGDLPSKAFAMRLSIVNNNQNNLNIQFYNNIWSDATGSMGAQLGGSDNDFSDTPPEETDSFSLLNNLYWNGNAALPSDPNELINYTDDPQRIIADPLLADQASLTIPRWDVISGQFADGSTTIQAAFVNLVQTFGIPQAGSPAINTADASQSPTEDILKNPRPTSQTDIGAYEQP